MDSAIVRKQVTLVGGSNGRVAYLTQAAWDVLEACDRIWVSSAFEDGGIDWREWPWSAKTVRAQWRDPAWRDSLQGDGSRQVAWVVPDSPAVSGDPDLVVGLSYLRQWRWQTAWVSGIPGWLFRLDELGLVTFPTTMTINGKVTIAWPSEVTFHDVPQFPWLHDQPLYNRTIVWLRDSPRAREAAGWLRQQGARVWIEPVSVIEPPERTDAWDRMLEQIARYDWLLLTSAEAVDRWFRRMREKSVDIRRLRAQIAVVGPETARLVRQVGLTVDLMPERDYSQGGLIEAFSAIPVRGSLMAFPGGQKNRRDLVEHLEARGARVDTAVIYRNRSVPLETATRLAIQNATVSALVFTASSQVEYLVEQLSMEERHRLRDIPLFSIGPATTGTLRQYGLVPAGEAATPNFRVLAELVRDRLAETSQKE